METKFWSGNLCVTKLACGFEPTKEAFIVYHGFPGEPPVEEADKYRGFPRKCIDVARALNAATRADVYGPHYEGLGDSMGKFSFTGSIAGAIVFAKEIAALPYETIHLVGNSWGGLAAYNAYRGLADKRGRLILISALLDLPSDDWIRQFLPYYVRSYPNVLGADPDAFERSFKDLREARRRYNPAVLVAQDRALAAKAAMIHGTKDETVPVASARAFAQAFGCRLLELEADHSYSQDRAAMVAAVLELAQQR